MLNSLMKRTIYSALSMGCLAVCMGFTLAGCGGTAATTTTAAAMATTTEVVTTTAATEAATITEAVTTAAVTEATTAAAEETTAADRAATITMEEIVSANKNETLVSRYSSFQNTLVDETGTLTNYADAEIYYSDWPDDDYGELYINGEQVYSHNGDVCFAELCADEGPILFYTDNILYSDSSTSEIIKSCEEKDGYLYITTELPREDTRDSMEERNYTYTEGEYLRIEYVLDAETLAQQSCTEIEVKADGTERLLGTNTVEYGLERPEKAQNLYEHVFAEDNLRTVTVIADPDTDDEKTYTKQIPIGDEVSIRVPGEDKACYADRACTEEFDSANEDGDWTIYIITKDRQ